MPSRWWKVFARFVGKYPDIVAENDWRWRFGLGDADTAVYVIAETFKLSVASDSRRAAALEDLEKIVSSPPWMEEAARNLENQLAREAAWQAKSALSGSVCLLDILPSGVFHLTSLIIYTA